jgi:hypothetical protein
MESPPPEQVITLAPVAADDRLDIAASGGVPSRVRDRRDNRSGGVPP